MILLCGIRSEPPLALAASALDRAGARYGWFDQRRALETTIEVGVADGAVGGRLAGAGLDLDLRDVRAVYVRTMDDRLLPELAGCAPDSPERRHVRGLHDGLMAWLEVTPALVINRAAAQASNASKPYQLQLIRSAGFTVPDTLVTSDPSAALEFKARHGRVVYKSMSGIRSIVSVLTDRDADRLDLLRHCPVQFQEYVEGVDVRVHVVGRDVFATEVTSWATDYRYPERSGSPAPSLRPHTLSPEMADRCVALTHALGLDLAGIDTRITPEGNPVCFEVNPSPAYSYYEEFPAAPISTAIARLLASA